jgi:hypothetical protein
VYNIIVHNALYNTKRYIMKKIISIDAETNGLWGKPFAIAAIIYELKTVKCLYVANHSEYVQAELKFIRVLNEEELAPQSSGYTECRVLRVPKWVETNKFIARLPDSAITDKWVKANVLPALASLPVTHGTTYDMLADFAAFYMKHKDADTLWHMGHVVEAYLFRLLVQNRLIGEWDAPYCPIEVSEHLRQAGEKPDNVDAYAKKIGVTTEYGNTHNPLYDCEVAARVFFHLKK